MAERRGTARRCAQRVCAGRMRGYACMPLLLGSPCGGPAGHHLTAVVSATGTAAAAQHGGSDHSKEAATWRRCGKRRNGARERHLLRTLCMHSAAGAAPSAGGL